MLKSNLKLLERSRTSQDVRILLQKDITRFFNSPWWFQPINPVFQFYKSYPEIMLIRSCYMHQVVVLCKGHTTCSSQFHHRWSEAQADTFGFERWLIMLVRGICVIITLNLILLYAWYSRTKSWRVNKYLCIIHTERAVMLWKFIPWCIKLINVSIIKILIELYLVSKFCRDIYNNEPAFFKFTALNFWPCIYSNCIC